MWWKYFLIFLLSHHKLICVMEILLLFFFVKRIQRHSNITLLLFQAVTDYILGWLKISTLLMFSLAAFTTITIQICITSTKLIIHLLQWTYTFIYIKDYKFYFRTINRKKTVELSYRSSHPKMFCKKGVLRNFEKLTGKHLC